MIIYNAVCSAFYILYLLWISHNDHRVSDDLIAYPVTFLEYLCHHIFAQFGVFYLVDCICDIRVKNLACGVDGFDAQLSQRIGELLEYQDCKTMAKKLSEQVDMDHLSRRPQKIPPDMRYKRLHEPLELFRAYIAAVGRGKRNLPPPIEAFSGIVAHKIVPISARVKYIMKKLFKQTKQKFTEFFITSQSRSEMAATFLALLSLTKDKKITVTGEGDNMEIEMLGDDPDYELGEDYFES